MGVDLSFLVRSLAEQATPEPGTDLLRLPTERELVSSLDISRGALREQLSMLEMLGFLTRTQGRGSYLGVPDAGFIQLYFDLSNELGQLGGGQFRSAREMLEISMSEAAARLATADDVEVLRDLVDEMVRASGAGEDDRALEADLDFHRRLFTIVDNPIFTLLHDGLSHVLRDEVVDRRRVAVARAPLAPGEERVIDTVHYGIVDAVENRDGEAARAAMRHHFEVWSSLTGES
ncbi:MULTISPECIES: FadR/GntR family transcriptional regulator [unclassified Saccharopolyspora]|uniref:FadR/GntR family transcriptional regulator n=1 Tax=unclassified Saccharopolyspora TaxID=2646250 RepID=UPI001CD4C8F1|nr:MULTISPECIES: FCD domain-containing protein [unclassified Saccharopolyspora]MCA1187377.1 FCD domain-containing protein [Saccharopolyspora sp. 6T]MCA1280885.1 FCD domain-containing protein [Saccharopolyspora sp. 7B]